MNLHWIDSGIIKLTGGITKDVLWLLRSCHGLTMRVIVCTTDSLLNYDSIVIDVLGIDCVYTMCALWIYK